MGQIQGNGMPVCQWHSIHGSVAGADGKGRRWCTGLDGSENKKEERGKKRKENGDVVRASEWRWDRSRGQWEGRGGDVLS